MYQSSYFVSKLSGTFSDTLMAFGLAYLLRNILQENDVKDQTVRIVDQGSYFEVSLNQPIESGFEDIAWFELIPFLETPKNRPPEGWNGVTYDYAEKRAEKFAYFEAIKQMPVEAKQDRNHPAREFMPDAPDLDLEFFEMINQMRGVAAYTHVWNAWHAAEACFPQLLRLILQFFSSPSNDLEALVKGWRALKVELHIKLEDRVGQVQVVNPTKGKGLHREKMDGASKIGTPKSFWLPELLKFYGAQKAALPRMIKAPYLNGPRDRKTYVVHPKNLTLTTHAIILEAFKKSLWSTTAVQLDIFAGLKYLTAFLQQWMVGQVPEVDMGQQPGDYVTGLEVAFYKDLGSAVALLNLSEIALPDWMKHLAEPADAQKYMEMLEEHRQIIWRLKEKNSTEYELLKTYRSFLSGRSLDAFFQFTTGYSDLLMTGLIRNESIRQLSSKNLEVIIMAHDKNLAPIYQTPGFQKIVKAIRHCPVVAQRRRVSRDAGYPYKPRYGLSNDLARNATYPDKFITALCEFVSEYNREVLRASERFANDVPRNYRRPFITEKDLQQVIALVDEYRSSGLIAQMLIAFGYSTSGQKQEDNGNESLGEQEAYDLNIDDEEAEQD